MPRDIVKINHTFLPENVNYGFVTRTQQDEEYYNEIEDIIKSRAALLKQEHGNNVIKIFSDCDIHNNHHGDAVITNIKNIAIGVRTADCLPILIYCHDINNMQIIAAVHAGWKGIFHKVIEKTIDELTILGCDPINMKIIIGPCISVDNYEISDEFMSNFLSQSNNNAKYFERFQDRHKDRYHFNLKSSAIEQLISKGIKKENIHDSNIDTFSDMRFTSFRRLKHENKDAKYEDLRNFYSYIELK